jgi:hypothetical protein
MRFGMAARRSDWLSCVGANSLQKNICQKRNRSVRRKLQSARASPFIAQSEEKEAKRGTRGGDESARYASRASLGLLNRQARNSRGRAECVAAKITQAGLAGLGFRPGWRR